MAIFLVMPGKPSFRPLHFNVGLRYERALLEKRRRGASGNKNTSMSILRDWGGVTFRGCQNFFWRSPGGSKVNNAWSRGGGT